MLDNFQNLCRSSLVIAASHLQERYGEKSHEFYLREGLVLSSLFVTSRDISTTFKVQRFGR